MSEYERIVAVYDADPKCHNYDFSVARARIAELEAENKRLVKAHNDLFNNWEEASGEAAKAEAELAALKGRRCDTCRWFIAEPSDYRPACMVRGLVDRHGDGSDMDEVYLLSWWGSAEDYNFRPDADFWCCHWAKRGTK